MWNIEMSFIGLSVKICYQNESNEQKFCGIFLFCVNSKNTPKYTLSCQRAAGLIRIRITPLAEVWWFPPFWLGSNLCFKTFKTTSGVMYVTCITSWLNWSIDKVLGLLLLYMYIVINTIIQSFFHITPCISTIHQ